MKKTLKEFSTGALFSKATRFALVQSKFHRITKRRMTEALKPFDLLTVEWIILGYLNHTGKEVSFSEVSNEVGVKDSFITVIATKLEARKLINVLPSSVDKRKKSMSITKDGKKILTLTQHQFMHFFSPLVTGLNERDLLVFLQAMKTVIKNYSSLYGK